MGLFIFLYVGGAGLLMIALNWGFRLAGFPDFPLSAISVRLAMMSISRSVVLPASISKATLMSMCPGGTFNCMTVPSASVALALTIVILILV